MVGKGHTKQNKSRERQILSYLNDLTLMWDIKKQGKRTKPKENKLLDYDQRTDTIKGRVGNGCRVRWGRRSSGVQWAAAATLV